jgi:hypothetical protein
MGRLYHDDFYGWALDQVDALRRRSLNEIDWDNLLDEIEDLSASKRRELRSRLALIIQHLLKWRCQPSFRSKSWLATIEEQRDQVRELLRENPSLRPTLEPMMPQVFRSGAVGAVRDTGLALETFEAQGPMTFEEVMTIELEHEPL